MKNKLLSRHRAKLSTLQSLVELYRTNLPSESELRPLDSMT
jgi:hypothetical protein